MERRFVEHVRPPREDEPVEEGWRPIDPNLDTFAPFGQDDERRQWPDDLTVLYWWRPTFWGDQS